MIMNIAFVSNFQKTYLFSFIADGLMAKGYSIYWICFSKTYYDYLCTKYAQEDILLLNREMAKMHNAPIGEYKLNELVYNDRALSYEREWGLRFLQNIQEPFLNFINKKTVRYVFGEMTYAHEILMNRICRDKLNGICDYLHPQSIRIPNGRFSFMDTEFQNSLHPSCIGVNSTDVADYRIPIEIVRPQRVAEIDREVKQQMSWGGKLARIKRMITEENIDTDSPSLIVDRKVRYVKAIREEINKYQYHKWKRLNLSDLGGRKFFLYTLHMQPEASVDVVGRYYDDQLQTIKNIWRILPNGYFLLVKEHSNAIGNRGYKFYKQCVAFPNVCFVDECADSHELIYLAQAIFTNSGTIGLESALKGRPAFVFSRIFYDKLSGVYNTTLDDLKLCVNYFDLLEKKQTENKMKMSVEEYSRYIIASSFPGVVDPPVSSPLFTDKTNIRTVVKSFDLFLKNA